MWFIFFVFFFLFIPIPSLHLTPADSPKTNTYIINMDNDSYSPKNLTIQQNDSVIFKNTSSENRWPASNIHPTHGIYPDFDSKKSLNPGESWQFKFDRSGRFTYHDHLYPNQTGIILVTATTPTSASQNPDIISQIKTNSLKVFYTFLPNQAQKKLDSSDIHTLAKNNSPELKQLLVIFGTKRVSEKLLQDTGNGSKKDCHQESHVIGRMSYELFGEKAFTHASSICHSGLYHGAMESLLSQLGSQELEQKVENICQKFPTSFSRFECLHGVGHGVMASENYDLPKSIEICQKLSNSFTRESCWGGVFMENIIVAEGKGTKTGHQTNWVSDDPHYPCNAIEQEERLQIQCYLMQTSRMLDLNNHDMEKIIPLCLSAPENMRHICYQSFGRDVAGQTLRNPQKIQEYCQKIPPEHFQNCLKGALYVIVEFHGDSLEYQPQQLCALQKGEDRNYCYDLLLQRLPGIFGSNKEKTKKACEYMSEYQLQCLKLATSD